MTSVPRLVGREREMNTLARAVLSGPTVMLVAGEAGIGKSRLVQEFLIGLPDDHPVLVVDCPPFREPYTLGPVVDAVRQGLDRVGGLRLSPLAGALRPLFPEWLDDLPPAPEMLGDERAARHRLFRALLELWQYVGASLLVVEDAHWADEATLEFLLFATSHRPQPMSLLVTYRPEDAPEDSLLRTLAGRCRGPRLALGALDVAQTARMVSSMMDEEPVSSDFAVFLHERTAGIPLVLEESVRLMYDRQDLVRDGKEWLRRRDLTEIDVPPTVRDAVLERACCLSPDARAVLRAAAVFTEPAGEDELAAVSALGKRFSVGLAQALERGMLREDAAGRVSFRHVLAARAVYESMPATARRVAHRRAGRALEHRRPLPFAILAYHFRAARDVERWSRYAERAADVALTASDDATATALLHDLLITADLPVGAVLRLADKIPSAHMNSDVQIRELVGVLHAALAGADAEEQGRLRLRLGRLLLSLGDIDAAHAELERAAAALPADSGEAVRAMALLSWPRGGKMTAADHLRWLHRSAELAALLSPAERLAHMVDRVTALLMVGEESGWAEAARIPLDATDPAELRQVIRGHMNIVSAGSAWGRYAQAQRSQELTRRLAQRYQYLRSWDTIEVNGLHLTYYTGPWTGLAERLAAVVAAPDVAELTQASARLVAGMLSAATGERAEAERTLGDVMSAARQHGWLEPSTEPAAALARLYLADGDPAAALRLTEESLAPVVRKQIWMWACEVAPVHIQALLAVGRDGEAAVFVAAFAGALADRDVPTWRAAIADCRAILAEARGELAAAADLSAQAAGIWQAMPRPHYALLSRERYGRCLLTDNAEDGLAVLSEVAQDMADLGAAGDAERVRTLLREHERRRGRRGYGDQLSPRELEVVQLVVTGRTNREIAGELSRSPRTVGIQLNSAMRKLGVTSRTALAVAALESGLVRPYP